jgi:uncharacterized membrane protein required for colicin V production
MTGIDLIYVFDIAVILIVLGYRGNKNGMLPESLFCLSTIVAGLAAEAYSIPFKSILSNLPGMNDPMVSGAVSYAIVFIVIRVGLAVLGLQIFTQLRVTPFMEPLNKYIGIIFAVIKAVFLTSFLLRFLSGISPFIPDLTVPIKDNSFVIFFTNILYNFYQPFS